MEKIKLSKLKVNPNNPRLIKDDKFKKLVKSLTDFPEMLEARPIVVNPDMVVLGGNMRLKACKDAGIKEAPVYVASWDEVKQKQFIIKDNVGFGAWDWDILANEWDESELNDWGLDAPEEWSGGQSGEGNFDDPGIDSESQYGVIVMCDGEAGQEATYKSLSEKGYNCKVVVV